MYSTTRIKKMMAKIKTIEGSGEVDILTAKLGEADIKMAELEATVIEQAKKIQALETQVSILPTAEAPK